jgi:hypothetical protein
MTFYIPPPALSAASPPPIQPTQAAAAVLPAQPTQAAAAVLPDQPTRAAAITVLPAQPTQAAAAVLPAQPTQAAAAADLPAQPMQAAGSAVLPAQPTQAAIVVPPLNPGKVNDPAVTAIPLQRLSKGIIITATTLSIADSLRRSVGAELKSRYVCLLCSFDIINNTIICLLNVAKHFEYRL